MRYDLACLFSTKYLLEYRQYCTYGVRNDEMRGWINLDLSSDFTVYYGVQYKLQLTGPSSTSKVPILAVVI